MDVEWMLNGMTWWQLLPEAARRPASAARPPPPAPQHGTTPNSGAESVDGGNIDTVSAATYVWCMSCALCRSARCVVCTHPFGWPPDPRIQCCVVREPSLNHQNNDTRMLSGPRSSTLNAGGQGGTKASRCLRGREVLGASSSRHLYRYFFRQQ